MMRTASGFAILGNCVPVAKHRSACRRIRGSPLDSDKMREAPERVICPSCQSAAGELACRAGQITGIFRASRALDEGRFAIVTKRWVRDAVDAAVSNDE
jgi:hypothetical protein